VRRMTLFLTGARPAGRLQRVGRVPVGIPRVVTLFVKAAVARHVPGLARNVRHAEGDALVRGHGPPWSVARGWGARSGDYRRPLPARGAGRSTTFSRYGSCRPRRLRQNDECNGQRCFMALSFCMGIPLPGTNDRNSSGVPRIYSPTSRPPGPHRGGARGLLTSRPVFFCEWLPNWRSGLRRGNLLSGESSSSGPFRTLIEADVRRLAVPLGQPRIVAVCDTGGWSVNAPAGSVSCATIGSL